MVMLSQNPLSSLFDRFRRTTTLSSDDLASLLTLPVRIREYGPNADVLREGDRPTQCCLVVEGYLTRFNVVERGKRQIISFHMAGDLPDLMSLYLGTLDHNLSTLTPAALAFIPHADIARIVKSRPHLAASLWRETLVDAAIHRQWVVNVGRREADARIAHLLCEQATRLKHAGLGDETGFPSFFTQTQLADATGLSVVHVNRMLQELRRRGLIGAFNRERVEILDWAGLVAAAGFDDTYLHLPSESLAPPAVA